jgi:hypothetical protein
MRCYVKSDFETRCNVRWASVAGTGFISSSRYYFTVALSAKRAEAQCKKAHGNGVRGRL